MVRCTPHVRQTHCLAAREMPDKRTPIPCCILVLEHARELCGGFVGVSQGRVIRSPLSLRFTTRRAVRMRRNNMQQRRMKA